MGMGKEAAAERADFLEWLGPDTSSIIFTLLHHPADLARASAVSRSWRTFVIENQFSKIQCLRVCPEASNFTSIKTRSPGSDIKEDVGSSSTAEWENQKRDHRVYLYLTHSLLSPYNSRDCIIQCIGASSTDNFPEESIENTLEPIDHVEMRPSYWSSGGQRDPNFPECLVYMLRSDLCLIDEIKIQPFKAFFQNGDPIYSAQYVRFRMGYSKLPLCPEQLVSNENEGQLIADDNYIWTYTSPQFPMLQESVLQSFKLPNTVLCIGGVVKIELLGRIQKQAMDVCPMSKYWGICCHESLQCLLVRMVWSSTTIRSLEEAPHVAVTWWETASTAPRDGITLQQESGSQALAEESGGTKRC